MVTKSPVPRACQDQLRSPALLKLSLCEIGIVGQNRHVEPLADLRHQPAHIAQTDDPHGAPCALLPLKFSRSVPCPCGGSESVCMMFLVSESMATVLLGHAPSIAPD
jgi:hypothetical protein